MIGIKKSKVLFISSIISYLFNLLKYTKENSVLQVKNKKKKIKKKLGEANSPSYIHV